MNKPAFKLRLDGGLELLAPATSGCSEQEVKQLIRRHYGSARSFSNQTGLPYWAVTVALSQPGYALRCSGWVQAARLYLGLRSEPTERAIFQAGLKFSSQRVSA